ncbi:MAG: CBS domain-containing protein [Alphaproteobacteria bacterium]|nr:CBS domain-containing protein [Alphaproteobacteria bacterium]MBL6939133.1 CBS domain-containing protein [Alphaproteobacteria bacterium]MBL7096649.1 CBS domain-containing protein [Alphaproteobacteria bacterium]
MKVAEVMCRSAKTINANETLKTAAQMMAREDVGFLPVEENDRLIGMITDRDIVTRCIAQGKDGTSRVRDAMTKDVKYCFENEDIDEVMDNMADLQIRRLPVMSRDKRLVGILSLADAARAYSPDAVGIAFSGVVSPGGTHAGDRNPRLGR